MTRNEVNHADRHLKSIGKPIYEQIEDQVKTAILAGQLKANEQLPSIRSLAKDLRISVITTTRAYHELEAAGFITNVQGKGAMFSAKIALWSGKTHCATLKRP